MENDFVAENIPSYNITLPMAVIFSIPPTAPVFHDVPKYKFIKF